MAKHRAPTPAVTNGTPYVMTIAEAIDRIEAKKTALLSVPDKMPCHSFSLPARTTCPGKLDSDPDDVCFWCYAAGRGNYRWTNTMRAQMARYLWTIDCMKTEAGRDHWVETMVAKIRKTEKSGYFRLHDSGDFFNFKYVEMWTRVCRALPDIEFWSPTKSWWNVPPKFAAALRELAALPNVIIHPSGLKVDGPAPVVPGLSAGSRVATDDTFTCPASLQDGKCLGCRKCWEKDWVTAFKLH